MITIVQRVHSLDLMTPDQLRDYPLADAGFGRKGYDRDRVRAYIASLAGYITNLRAQRDDARRQLTRREREVDLRRHGVHLPAYGPTGELFHAEQIDVHLAAQRTAEQIIAVAQAQAATIIEDALTQARAYLAAPMGPSATQSDAFLQILAAFGAVRACLRDAEGRLGTAERLVTEGSDRDG